MGEEDIQRGNPGRTEICLCAALCVSADVVLGLIVGVGGHTAISALSAALRLTHRAVFHPLSPLLAKSRGRFQHETQYQMTGEGGTVTAV